MLTYGPLNKRERRATPQMTPLPLGEWGGHDKLCVVLAPAPGEAGLPEHQQRYDAKLHDEAEEVPG